MKEQYEDLLCAYKQESNPKAKERMLAVLNIIERSETIPTIAKTFHRAYNSIKNWML